MKKSQDIIKEIQILIHKDIYRDTKQVLKPNIQYHIKAKPIVLSKEITVNECNAAEKIKGYPEAIQKLVWRALQYKCEIKARRSMPMRTNEDYTKLTKYIETFRHTQQLIIKMCKRKNLGWIIIEGGF